MGEADTMPRVTRDDPRRHPAGEPHRRDLLARAHGRRVAELEVREIAPAGELEERQVPLGLDGDDVHHRRRAVVHLDIDGGCR
jgi:hypothetical protein